MTTPDKPPFHWTSIELQAFLVTHPTYTDMLRDLDSLPPGVASELMRFLWLYEVMCDLEREGYVTRVR